MEKQYTYKEVKDIIYNIYDTYNIQDTYKFDERFECRLNDRGLNWNNWANENRLWDFHESDIESFIY
jgi:hypothetical protein